MKQNKYTFFVALCLLMIIFYMNQWINYYRLQETPDDKKIQEIQQACMAMQIVLLIVLVGGTIIYFQKQYTDKGEAFQITRFFFGTNKCQSLQDIPVAPPALVPNKLMPAQGVPNP